MNRRAPAPSYRLVRSGSVATAPPPDLDDAQRRVVEHEGGPLLVLAGPGTGKTTTLVEAIARRVERGDPPDSVLSLTFSRKAAEQLRDRVTARLGRTTATTPCSTFHSFAYALVRLYAPAELYAAPLRLLSAPEQDVVVRELLAETPESVRWPASMRRAVDTRGFAHEVAAVLGRAREKGLDGEVLTELGLRHDVPEFVAAGHFLEQYLTILDDLGATDHADLIRRATLEARVHRDELRRRFRCVFVDEYQDTDPGQVALLRALAGDGRDLVVVGDPHQSIYGFRGADVRGILDFPREFPRSDGTPAEVVALGTTRRFGPRLLTATQRVAGRLPVPGGLPEEAREAFTAPRAEVLPPRPAPAAAASRWSPSTPSAPRPSTSPTSCAAPTSRTASTGVTWRSWCARVAPPSPACAARSARPACRSRWLGTTCRSCATPPCAPCWRRCGSSCSSTTRARRGRTSATDRISTPVR